MTETPYILHYAPDNASLVIRLALEEIGAHYSTRLVDRRKMAQRQPAYLRLNPKGQIPVLETSDGPLFETAAILLWLADRHGGIAPGTNDPRRGEMLKWLFLLSNTLHPSLRMIFYPEKYIGEEAGDQIRLATCTQRNVLHQLDILEARFASPRPGMILDLYLAPMLRWLALYPVDTDKAWFDLSRFPALFAMARAMETRAATRSAANAEGLGPDPFTAPRLPTPPEGSAI